MKRDSEEELEKANYHLIKYYWNVEEKKQWKNQKENNSRKSSGKTLIYLKFVFAPQYLIQKGIVLRELKHHGFKFIVVFISGFKF